MLSEMYFHYSGTSQNKAIDSSTHKGEKKTNQNTEY